MPDRRISFPSLGWPALRSLAGTGEPPGTLEYRRAVWTGEPDGAPAGEWSRATPDFDLVSAGSEVGRVAAVAHGAAEVRFPLWRAGATDHLALVYRGGGGGEDRRPVVVQVVQCSRDTGLPAAAAALVLLRRAGRLDESHALEDPPAIDPGPESTRPLEVDLPAEIGPDDLDREVDAGVDALRLAVGRDQLARFYGELLAEAWPAVLETNGEPLEPAALAALLLPLDPERAVSICLSGWVRADHPGREALGRAWHGVAAGPEVAATLIAGHRIDDTARRHGERLAAALYANDPDLLESGGRATGGVRSAASSIDERPIELAMWGTVSSGKTVFLAQLILAAAGGGASSGWTVWPTEELLAFSREMRSRIETSNLFPPATIETGADRVDYRFRRESDGLAATLSLEDRAGIQWQRLDDAVKERLESADGIVLMVDPERDTGQRDAQIRDTLDHLAAVRGARRDPRPLAVCLSKADLLIETPEDLRTALETPEVLVRRHLDPDLLATLEQYHSDVRLFATSAIGIRLRWGVVEPAVFYDESFTPRIHPGARPIHLLTPFTWLLDRAAARRAEEAA